MFDLSLFFSGINVYSKRIVSQDPFFIRIASNEIYLTIILIASDIDVDVDTSFNNFLSISFDGLS